jgi:hypothetical protein
MTDVTQPIAKGPPVRKAMVITVGAGRPPKVFGKAIAIRMTAPAAPPTQMLAIHAGK